MMQESLIQLDITRDSGCVLVTSPQFPFLNLAVPTGAEDEIRKHVLPVLREMVEFEVGAPVNLRLVPILAGQDDEAAAADLPPPHVLATLQEARGG